MEAVTWAGDAVEYIDQRRLPHETIRRRAQTIGELESAIATLAVRGAPAIGIFGAYAVAQLRKTIPDDAAFARAAQRIRQARPTAVNLEWAVDRVLAASDMLHEAREIHREQHAIDEAIANAGRDLIPKNAQVLTHCNTGPLATAGSGTALGVIIAAHRAGKAPHVYVDETRPLLQGARLTCFELAQEGVHATLQVDAAAAMCMKRNGIDLVIVGADRICANGDTANKIGTYALAIAAAHHGIPLYVAAPRATFDFTLGSGDAIPIEERAADEVIGFAGTLAASSTVRVYNPAFDVTPAHLITAFITEYGIVRSPYPQSIASLEMRPNFGSLIQEVR